VAESLPAWKRFLELALGAKRVYRQWGFRRLRAPRAGSRRGWSDEDLLRAAVDYVEIGGRRRVIELAKRWGIERTQARDLLNACTQKGYLTRGRPGVASRGLTDHALQILAERSKK
jgi:transposase-like protein